MLCLPSICARGVGVVVVAVVVVVVGVDVVVVVVVVAVVVVVVVVVIAENIKNQLADTNRLIPNTYRVSLGCKKSLIWPLFENSPWLL